MYLHRDTRRRSFSGSNAFVTENHNRLDWLSVLVKYSRDLTARTGSRKGWRRSPGDLQTLQGADGDTLSRNWCSVCNDERVGRPRAAALAGLSRAGESVTNQMARNICNAHSRQSDGTEGEHVRIWRRVPASRLMIGPEVSTDV